MPMGCRPMGKAAKRIFVLHNQIIGKRQYLSVAVRETGFKVIDNTRFAANAIKQIGGAIKIPGRHYGRHRCLLAFPGKFLFAGRDYLFGLRIKPANAFTFGTRLLLLLVPVRNRFIDIGGPGFLVCLVDDSSHL